MKSGSFYESPNALAIVKQLTTISCATANGLVIAS